ncbi:MAG: Gfo/Idh/MocA family oxidoreductase [Candidatus Latescibacterota bacterium]|nr:Gfo/Idh/MocA family oxidoreductase [Candidatus Latescibacterota bacterium]
MSTYSAVIVGLTGIGSGRNSVSPLGRMPRSHAAAYYSHPDTTVAAVCDLRPEALTEFEKTWSDVWPDLQYYSDYREMLDKLNPDILSVVTPDDAHAKIVIDGSASGVPAILCEKPIATTLAEADLMTRTCEENETLLSIENTRRWDPSFVNALKIIQSEELGPLRTIVGEMFSPRAMLFRNGIHLIDLFNFYAAVPAKWVFSELEMGFDTFREYSGDGGRSPDSDPYASAYIHYENGIRGFLNSYKTTFPGWQMQLTCENGRLHLSDRNIRLIRATSHYQWEESDVVTEPHMYTNQLGAVAELVNALKGEDVSLSCPPKEARKALELVIAMLKSHTEGNRRVDLPLGE